MKSITVENQTYVWNALVDRVSIRARKRHARLQRVGDLLLIALGVGLFVVFLSFFFFVPSDLTLIDPFLWIAPHDWSLFFLAFWVALLCAMILFARHRMRRVIGQTLPKVHLDLKSLPAVEDRSADAAIEITPFLHEESVRALEEAYETALRFKNSEVTPLHLFMGALTTNDAARFFLRLDLTFDELKEPLLRRLTTEPAGKTPLWSEQVRAVVCQAIAIAVAHGREKLHPLELMLAVYENDSFVQELLFSRKIERLDVTHVAHWIRVSDELLLRARAFSKAAAIKPRGAMNRAYTSVATPLLDTMSEDLTHAATLQQLPMLIGREEEMNSMLRAMEGGNQSVVLVGESGVGKDALIAGLAQRMVEERVPALLQDKRLVRLSLPHLLAGTRGMEAETRLLQVLHEIGTSGNIVTVLEDVDQIVGSGFDLSSVLLSALEKQVTLLVATTTPEAYVSRVERSALGQKLVKLVVNEPSVDEAILILQAHVPFVEYRQKVLFTYQALAACVKDAKRYLHERLLPESAIELSEEVALAVRQKRGERARITAEDVARIVSEKSHIPVSEMGAAEKEILLDLEARLHERVIGQEEAVLAVSAALRRARTDLRSQERPIATFLFLGPTGVGKTELAKAVSEIYFGSEEAMNRFDMSEFPGAEAVERLLGSPGRGGALTEAVRQKPFSVLLLDEFEKARPEVLNLFLQVMDDGRLTDGTGRTIDFTNSILIATSNAGSRYIQEAVRDQTPLDTMKKELLERELSLVYPPELLNRFDGIIVFKPLQMDEVTQIAYLLLSKVTERLQAKGIALRVEDAAVYELAQKGFDPQFGARPLRRVIQEHVDHQIAKLILKGDVGRRDTLVLKAGGSVEVEKAPPL